MKFLLFFVSVILLATGERSSSASIFGEETAVLLEIAGNQVTELNRLAENIGVTRDQRNLLIQVNDGIQKTTQQIQAIDEIVQRVQSVDPTAIHNLAQLNETIENMKYASTEIQDLLIVKLFLCEQAEREASLQADTAYKMGQEMANLGSKLAEESKTASPGRAEQIAASASSAQTLAAGVELQTLSHMSQLLAMSLDLQKTQMERETQQNLTQRAYIRHALKNDKSGLLKVAAGKKRKGKSL